MLRPLLDKLRFRYGSLRETLRNARYKSEYLVGLYRPRKRVAWSRVSRLVFVCQGNIMRSAYGEAFARREGLRAASFGVKISEPMTPELGRKIARERGLPLESHRAKPVSEVSLAASDLVLLVDPRHAPLLDPEFRRSGCQWSYLGLFSSSPNAFMADPYGKHEAYVRRCFELIEQGILEIRQQLDIPGSHR